AAAGGPSRRRAVVVAAALEMGRRATATPLRAGGAVKDAEAVHAHFRGRLPQLDREVFYVLLLDGKNRVQGEVRVSEGSLTAALVHPREVFAPAIREAAAALILVHNHPSGDPTPSAEDRAITERLRQVGELVGIRVLDHVVIGKGRYASMADEGRWGRADGAERAVVGLAGGGRGGRHLFRARPPSSLAAPAAEELDALGDDLGHVAAVAFLVVVLPGADRTLDVHLPSLGEVLAAGLGLLAPHHD